MTRPAPFAPDPERAVQRARTAAQRALVLRLHAAGWGRWCPGVVGPLAAVLAEIAVDASWVVFKNEISAWQRQYRVDAEDLLWDPHREEGA